MKGQVSLDGDLLPWGHGKLLPYATVYWPRSMIAKWEIYREEELRNLNCYEMLVPWGAMEDESSETISNSDPRRFAFQNCS